jgi:hypothetical protein
MAQNRRAMAGCDQLLGGPVAEVRDQRDCQEFRVRAMG